MIKPASPDFPILSAIEKRWSPRAYSDKPVSEQDVRSILEAARWAASGFNEQPWRFIVGIKGNGSSHEKLASTLKGFNAVWASKAPVLMIACAALTYHNSPPPFIGKPNNTADFEVGQAVGYLTLQATELGLHMRQMGGFEADKAREVFGIPENYRPLAAMAIGYMGEVDDLNEELAKREMLPRVRMPQGEFVFSENWNESL